MENNLRRARDMLPSIMITVLSMIQALALELYWTNIEDAEFLWQGGWHAAIGWVQLAVMLLGILLIWVMYVSLMLRFSWLPSMQDTLTPFAIGLMEFSMIDLMGPNTLGPWFLLLAAVFTVSMGTTHATHRRARRDPENDYFFKNFAPASWRDYGASFVAISGLIVCGIGLWISGNQGAVAVAALVYAAAMLTFQMLSANRYWMHTLVPAERAK